MELLINRKNIIKANILSSFIVKEDSLKKGLGGGLPPGTIRLFGNKKFQKQANGKWLPVKEQQQQQTKDNSLVTQSTSSSKNSPTSKQNGDKKRKVLKKIREWKQKQHEFYSHGGHLPNSKERKSIGKILRKKIKGIVTGIKHEIEEFKFAGSAIKKVLSGDLKGISKEEKKALKQIAIHTGMVVGTMALTGGVGSLFSHGLSSFVKHMGIHYLEHAGIMRVGHALLFAKGEKNIEGMSDDELLEEFVLKIIEHIESGEIEESDFKNIVKKSGPIKKKKI